jgi:hypothetical protein
MKKEENISRRDAFKRMAKTAMVVAVASILPSENSLAKSINSNSEHSDYVDRCYNDYTNYHNYSNHQDYYNYGNYKDYSNYRDYSNYSDAAK